MPGMEAAFLAPLDVRKIPGVGKVTEKRLHECGVRLVRDLAAMDEGFLGGRFGKWGLALAGKARGLDAGGWFDEAVGAEREAKSLGHEHTFNEDTADPEKLEATLARLSEMVGRRLREHGYFARTVQLKLRDADFTTHTRAVSLDHATQIDAEIFPAVRALFRKTWKRGAKVRLLGVQTSSFEDHEGQTNLLAEDKTGRWRKALTAMDRLRDKYGDASVTLAAGMTARFQERVQENPAGLPGKDAEKK